MVDLLHVSDTHLGYHQYRSPLRRDDFSDAFDQSVDIAIEEDVDAVVHTGDLFHSKSPGLRTQIDAVESISRLDDENIDFLAIVGNHERKRDEQFLDYIDRAVGNLVSLEHRPWIRDDVVVHGFDAIPSHRWDSPLEIGETYADTRIVAMHQLVSPLVPELFSPKSGPDLLNRFDLPIDALLLGDYHERCATTLDDTLLTYPGSTERVSRDEPGEKHVSLLRIDDEIEIEARSLDTRPFEEIEVSLDDSTDPRDQIRRRVSGRDLEDSVVHLVLEGVDVPLETGDLSYGEICRVIDRRSSEIEVEAVDHSTEDLETAVDQRISESDLSETAVEIDEIVRDPEVQKTSVRDEVVDLLEDRSP